MDKLKIVSVVGTRPEVIRLSRVFSELDAHCEHISIHTGQNYDYELNEIFYDELRIRKPDYFLNCAKNSKSPADTIGKIISSVDTILQKEDPAALIVLGDTNSCLSVISAKRRKIPIFHMEAGNRCFDMRVPEEINRRIVDHTADINLTYSDIAREYLLREGLAPEKIIKTGSPMFEVLNYYLPNIKTSNILKKLNLRAQNYYVVSAHREENIDNKELFLEFIDTLNEIAEGKDLPIIFSAHPRTSTTLNETSKSLHQNIHIMKPLGFFDYINLQMQSKAVLSDSGTISEESSIMNFPALNIRETHERPEAMEEAAVMLVGMKKKRILQALRILENQKTLGMDHARIVADYNFPDVSKKIVRIIHSYTDYINRVDWQK